MEKEEVKTGDTFLVKSDTFLSRIICKVMKRWGKRKGYDTSIVYSHAARFIWIDNVLYLFGSVINGYNPIEFDDNYDWKTTDFAVMRHKPPLTDDEEKRTRTFCLHLDSVSITYQYWNFVQWLALVYLRINLFTKDSEKFCYCYESERMCRKDLYPQNYGDVNRTDVFDLLFDKDYEIIYRSDPGASAVLRSKAELAPKKKSKSKKRLAP
jgi:hypothetical protein